MAEHGIVKGSNGMFHNGSPNSNGTTAKGASPVHPANDRIHNGNPNNGSVPMAKHASPVKGSNEQFKFNVANAKMPQPPSAVQPGKGDIPVNPFMGPGGSTPIMKKA